jgi:hypothetical protein
MLKSSYSKTIDLASAAVAFALVQFGGGVSQIRGSINGTVFSRNRSGAIARGRTKPVNPVTQRQSEVRAAFGQASSSWGSLTAADVADWEAYAALVTRINGLGETYTPKGRQIFMEISQNLQITGQTPRTKPSAFTDVPSMLGTGAVTLTDVADLITVFTMAGVTIATPSGAIGSVIFEASPPHDVKKTNVNNMFRQIAVSDSDIDPIDLEAGYIAVFGPTVFAGQVIDIRARVIDHGSGLGSSWLLTQVTVT